MNSYVATAILIASVLTLMQATCDVIAFVHGWEDGPDSHTRDRHAWLPRLFYETGWRLRRFRLTIARRELEQARTDREEAAARFYAALDAAVQDELTRKGRG